MKTRLKNTLSALMMVPGLSGYEDRVRRAIAARLDDLGVAHRTDMLGNLIASFEGTGPSVMLFAHMDQLGMIVRRIEPDGLLRFERLGGVPERALPAQAVLVAVGPGRDVPGVIANKSHHATTPDEKYQVVPYSELYIDIGATSADEVRAMGINIGTPVVYAPRVTELAANRIAGTSVDDRAGCAILLEVARSLSKRRAGPPVHLVFSVLEEFNLRGAQPLAQTLQPDIAIQIDLILATDTPDMGARGDVRLGAGAAMSMYSFHGHGTLNGVIPHPAMVALIEAAAKTAGLPLQRSAHVGALTDLSYVQLAGGGVASIDLGFPMRYSHSALEVCDLNDLASLTQLLDHALAAIGPGFSLDRDDYTQ